MKIWRLNNKEHIKNYSKEYQKEYRKRKDFKELNKIRQLRYHSKSKEKYKETCRRWIKNNPLKWKAYCHKRRVLTKSLSVETVQRVYEDNIKKYGTLTCYLCIKPIHFGKDSLEHKTPLSRGGTNLYENLAVAHRRCNNQKFTKTEEEYRLTIKTGGKK